MRTLRTNRPHRSRVVAAAVLSASLVLGACGGGEEESAGEDPSAAGDQTDGAATDGGETTDDGGGAGGETTDGGGDATSASCDTFEGEEITLAVGSSPGGGYDAYMRMLAPYLEEELGATVVVDNETGGGGLLMINNAVAAAEQDGTKLMIINGIGAAGSQLAGGEGINYDIEELSYVGMVSSEPPVLVSAADSEYETLEDVIAAEGFQFGATGVASSANTNAQALIAAFGLDASVATAFEGSSELDVALLAGDIDGFTGSLDSRITAVDNGENQALLIVNEETPDALSGTPNLTEVTDLYVEGGQEIMDTHLALTQFHRPLATHPDVPEDRLECLRSAFEQVMQNEDLIAESEEQDRPLAYRPGEEVADLASRIMDAPEAYRDMIAGTVE